MNRPSAFCFLLIASAPACGTSSDPGVEVRVVSQPVALGSDAHVESALGQEVALDAIEWTTAEVELLPCVSAWNTAMDWLIPSAHAHGVGTPTRLSVPTVERASTTDEVLLGTLAPPAGRYCGVRYRLAAADSDAHGLEVSPEMLGRSFGARGRFSEDGATTSDFAVESTRSRTAEYPIELELSESHRRATLVIARESASWFSSVDLTAASSEREAELLENFLGFTQVVER